MHISVSELKVHSLQRADWGLNVGFVFASLSSFMVQGLCKIIQDRLQKTTMHAHLQMHTHTHTVLYKQQQHSDLTCKII